MPTRYTGGDFLETLIATFGSARLVRNVSGRFELRGGNDHDLVEAREWTALFMPEATFSHRPVR